MPYEKASLITDKNGTTKQVYDPEAARLQVVQNHSSLSVAISPNVLNRWVTPVDEPLAVTFVDGTEGEVNEYMMEFTVGGSGFALSLPSNVRWTEEPVWETGNTYQVSILNGLAIYAGWEADLETETEEEEAE